MVPRKWFSVKKSGKKWFQPANIFNPSQKKTVLRYPRWLLILLSRVSRNVVYVMDSIQYGPYGSYQITKKWRLFTEGTRPSCPRTKRCWIFGRLNRPGMKENRTHFLEYDCSVLCSRTQHRTEHDFFLSEQEQSKSMKISVLFHPCNRPEAFRNLHQIRTISNRIYDKHDVVYMAHIIWVTVGEIQWFSKKLKKS